MPLATQHAVRQVGLAMLMMALLLPLAGASDCASQVGVMLETARVLISNPDLQLAAPVVFLFIGGEETFSQAAHGFMRHNKRPLGVFLNLESTGPGGPDYVFQHTGSI